MRFRWGYGVGTGDPTLFNYADNIGALDDNENKVNQVPCSAAGVGLRTNVDVFADSLLHCDTFKE